MEVVNIDHTKRIRSFSLIEATRRLNFNIIQNAWSRHEDAEGERCSVCAAVAVAMDRGNVTFKETCDPNFGSYKLATAMGLPEEYINGFVHAIDGFSDPKYNKYAFSFGRSYLPEWMLGHADGKECLNVCSFKKG